MNFKMCLFIICFYVSANNIFASDTARVVRVIDGDTYVLRKGNVDFHARLMNIDAPELKQPFGYLSYIQVNRLLIGKTIQYDSIKKDLYGRTLFKGWLNNQRLDSLIIRNGWAWHYQTYSNDTMLHQCMINAINEKIGLWKCGMIGICPPSFWRSYDKKNRAKFCSGCKINY